MSNDTGAKGGGNIRETWPLISVARDEIEAIGLQALGSRKQTKVGPYLTPCVVS